MIKYIGLDTRNWTSLNPIYIDLIEYFFIMHITIHVMRKIKCPCEIGLRLYIMIYMGCNLAQRTFQIGLSRPYQIMIGPIDKHSGKNSF